MDVPVCPLLAALLTSLALTCDAQYAFATVEQGAVRGSVERTVLGTTYHRFLAIPFAEPPLGELRFLKSRPPAPWEGVRDALAEAPLCLQPGKGSEDCLYLNVFVPAAAAAAANATGQLLPVLAWIPGGGYVQSGASLASFGPDFFLDRGIVVVTMNYRLAALGFLSLEDEVIPGNAGLKDQLMALQWVQRNIAAFGGDPARVSIGGASAGGCSSSHHFISPKSAVFPTDIIFQHLSGVHLGQRYFFLQYFGCRPHSHLQGLFRGVMIQNGQAVSPWGIAQGARDMAFRLGALLGLQTDDPRELAAFLRQQDARLFIDRVDDLLTDDEKARLTHLGFAPVVEPDVEDAIVTEHPIKVLKEGRFNKVPVLTGVTSGEGWLFISNKGFLNDPAELQNFNDKFEVATAPHVHLPTEEERVNATWQLHDFYFGDGDITLDDAQGLVDLATDQHFAEPTDSLVRYVSQLSDQPVYYYLFDYRGASGGNTTYGTPHAAETKFLFLNNASSVEWDPNTLEGALRQMMVDTWSNFIKFGDPNAGSDNVRWEPFSVSSPNFLHITAEYSLEQNKDKERMDFWHENIPM